MALTVTLSSVGTATMYLNPVAKATTVQLTASSSQVATVQLDMTLDDPSTTPAPTIAWSLLSSAAAIVSSNSLPGVGLVYTILSPIGGVRINSSTNASPVVFTLKALQSVTG
jgi:hypothetical protein